MWVPVLNLGEGGGPGVPLLNYDGGPGSSGPGPTFTSCPLNLVKDKWSKLLPIEVFPAHGMWSKRGVNCTV